MVSMVSLYFVLFFVFQDGQYSEFSPKRFFFFFFFFSSQPLQWSESLRLLHDDMNLLLVGG